MEQQPYLRQPYPNRPNAFAAASLIFGIIAMFSSLILYSAVFFGCLSILFALLSRQESLKMPGSSKAGYILSAIAMILSAVITALAFAYLVHLFGWETVLDPEALVEKAMEYLNSMGGAMQ